MKHFIAYEKLSNLQQVVPDAVEDVRRINYCVNPS